MWVGGGGGGVGVIGTSHKFYEMVKKEADKWLVSFTSEQIDEQDRTKTFGLS